MLNFFENLGLIITYIGIALIILALIGPLLGKYFIIAYIVAAIGILIILISGMIKLANEEDKENEKTK